jgi:hypothetical protein
VENRILPFRSGLEFYDLRTCVGDGSSLILYLSFGWYTQVCWQAVFDKYLCFDIFWRHYSLFAFCVVVRTGSAVQ